MSEVNACRLVRVITDIYFTVKKWLRDLYCFIKHALLTGQTIDIQIGTESDQCRVILTNKSLQNIYKNHKYKTFFEPSWIFLVKQTSARESYAFNKLFFVSPSFVSFSRKNVKCGFLAYEDVWEFFGKRWRLFFRQR